MRRVTVYVAAAEYVASSVLVFCGAVWLIWVLAKFFVFSSWSSATANSLVQMLAATGVQMKGGRPAWPAGRMEPEVKYLVLRWGCQ